MDIVGELSKVSCQPDLVEMLAHPLEAFPVELVEAVVQRDGKHLQNSIDASRARL